MFVELTSQVLEQYMRHIVNTCVSCCWLLLQHIVELQQPGCRLKTVLLTADSLLKPSFVCCIML